MPRRQRVAVELITVAVVAFVVYGALWSAQRALAVNGLDPTAIQSVVRPHADVAAGRAQTAAVVVLGLVACGLLIWLVARAEVYRRERLGSLAIAGPTAVAVGLFLLPPTLSDDVYSYLSHGYLAATPGHNPYLDASSSVGSSAYGRLLIQHGWLASHPPTPYGPLWTAVERVAYTLAGNDVDLGVLLLKLPVLLSVLATAALIHRSLRNRDPQVALRGSLLFLANPLVLIELAGDGHNDGVMALLLVVGIVAALRNRAFLAVIAIAAAVLVKSSALPLVLPVLVYLVVRRRSLRAVAAGIVLAGVAGAAAAAILIAPYWAGARTFAGLQSGSQLQGWSVPGLLDKVASALAHAVGSTSAAASGPVQLVLVLLLVLATAALSVMATTASGLLRACGAVSLLVLLLLPFDWPWYATMPCAILPLLPDLIGFVAVGLLAVTSRLAAPLGDAVGVGVFGYVFLYGVQTLVAQAIPAASGLVLSVLGQVPDRLLPAHVARFARALAA